MQTKLLQCDPCSATPPFNMEAATQVLFEPEAMGFLAYARGNHKPGQLSFVKVPHLPNVRLIQQGVRNNKSRSIVALAIQMEGNPPNIWPARRLPNCIVFTATSYQAWVFLSRPERAIDVRATARLYLSALQTQATHRAA
jgi:hypothetical protein